MAQLPRWASSRAAGALLKLWRGAMFMAALSSHAALKLCRRGMWTLWTMRLCHAAPNGA